MGFNPSSNGIAGASDVVLNSPINAQVLTYDIASQKWKNANVSEYVIDVTKYGLKGDGSTDNTTALNNLIASLPSILLKEATDNKPEERGFYSLFFPSGRYTFSEGFSFANSITIRGDGESSTFFVRRPGSSGDFFTFNGNLSTIRDLAIDSSNAQSGDDIVFDAAYARAQNLYLLKSAGTALRFGKSKYALAHRVDGVLVRAPYEYGAWITRTTDQQVEGDSTDGIWSNCDIGMAGLSAIRIDSSAQNMTNIHTWGSGSRKITGDNNGFLITSKSNLMSNCQAETNYGHGFFFRDSDVGGSIVTGSKSWANGASGFAATLYNRLSLVGWAAFDNGLRRGNGTGTSNTYAGIRNEGSEYMSVASGRSYDSGSERTVVYPGTESEPSMSRNQGVNTQIYDYIEIVNGTNRPRVGHNTGNYYGNLDGVVLEEGGSGTWSGNSVHSTLISIASASNLPIRANHEVVLVTGTTAIDTIDQGRPGQRVMLKFVGTASVTSSPTSVKLTQAFTASPNAYLELLYDGSRWVEVARG